jgi:HK97 family phage prohead protease
MRIKNANVLVKAGPDAGLEDGQFEAYASVFGNIDSYGDVVQPGAFANTLKEWADSGNFLPVLFGHNMSDPDYNIGHVIEATEDEKGLRVLAQLDLESPKGAHVHRMLKGKRISQMSFAYDVVKGTMGQLDGVDVYELHDVKIYEVSLVTIGANQETEILAVKTAMESLTGGVKEGRVLSSKHVDSLRAARDSIDAVLAAAEPVTDQEKANGNGEVKAEDGVSVKAEEPILSPSARFLAWAALDAELAANA